MNPMTSPTVEILCAYSGDRIEELHEVLDTLHTAASEDTLKTCTTLEEDDLVDLLRELIYTAQETIREIEHRAGKAKASRQPRPANILSLVPRDVAESRNA